MENKTYQTPELLLLEVISEQGFAASVSGEIGGFDREVWDE